MAKTTLKIGYMPVTDHLVLGVSYKHDISRFNHLNLEPVKFRSWEELYTALYSGKIQGAFILAPLAMKLRSQGVKIKAVCLGHREGSVLVVRSSIKSVKELKGKTI